MKWFFISWERALLFHKVFSMSSIIAGIVHGIYNLIPSSATAVYQSPILFGGVSLLVLMSLQPIMHVFLKVIGSKASIIPIYSSILS